MSDKEDSPGAESFHSLDAEGESSSCYADAEFFSDTYGEASIDAAVVPERVPSPPPVLDEMAALRARLEAMTSYVGQEEQNEDEEQLNGRMARRGQQDNGERYSSGGYLDSYANAPPRKPPPDRRRQREVSLTRAEEQKKRESGFTGSNMSVENSPQIEPGDLPFELQLPDFSYGYTEELAQGSSSRRGDQSAPDEVDDLYRREFQRSNFSFENQSDASRSPIPSDFERRTSSGRFDEFDGDENHSDHFERVSRETDDIIRQITATLGDAHETMRSYSAAFHDDFIEDFRDDEIDPILQDRFPLETIEMEFSPSPQPPISSTYQRRISRRMSFEQSGLETKFTAAELEDERTPSPDADLQRYRAQFAHVRRDSTIEKLESLLGAHAPEKSAFLDTETMEEISTYGKIRKVKRQRSEDQRILEEFDRHFDLCFDDSGEEDEFVSINDVEDVADRAAGRIPEDFYTEMLAREKNARQAAEANVEMDAPAAASNETGDVAESRESDGENNTIRAPRSELFDLQRSREVLDLIEATKKNIPIHMERRRSFYDELSDVNLEPRRSLDGQCKTRALTPPGDELTLVIPRFRLQTQRSDASTADSEMLFVPIREEKERSQSPSRDEGLRASRGFFESLDMSELEEKAKLQRIIPFDDAHASMRVGTAMDELADRPKTPVKAWRAELNLKTGEKMYESERYGGKDRNPEYGDVFGRLPARRLPGPDQPTYEAFDRKSRRDQPCRMTRVPRSELREDRTSQKYKFASAPATTITSAFSATIVDSDSYGEVPITSEDKLSTFPRKTEKRRRKTSLPGTRTAAEKSPSQETSKDRFLRDVEGAVSSREENQKRLQDWRANFHQFPLSSESTEAPPIGLDVSPGLSKVPSYELIESPCISEDAPARRGSLRRGTGPRSLDPVQDRLRPTMGRTRSTESAGDWSQSGYFVKPPPRRARSRQSLGSCHSAVTDSPNVSERFDSKGRQSEMGTLQGNLLGVGVPQRPKRTRSASRSINRLHELETSQLPKDFLQPLGYGSDGLKPVAPRRRSRSTSMQRLPQQEPEIKVLDPSAKTDERSTSGANVRQDVEKIPPTEVGTGAFTSPSMEEGSLPKDGHRAKDNAKLAVGSPEQKDYEKVVVKLGRRESVDKADGTAESGIPEDKCRETSASCVASKAVCSDPDEIEDEAALSDEEISSAFTVTFKPGSKVVDIEETPIQSSKSSSRRSSNSGLDERLRSKARRNQELLQKALQGMDAGDDVTEDFDSANADLEFGELVENLPYDREQTPQVIDEVKRTDEGGDEVATPRLKPKHEAGGRVEDRSVKTAAVDEELTKSTGRTREEGTQPEVHVTQAAVETPKSRTDSPYSVKRDKTYYSDTGETVSTASHVTAIEKPKIEVIRSSSVESGYEVVDTSGSGSKPQAPIRRRRSSAVPSTAGSVTDIKIMAQDKFGLVKPTYSDLNEWARRALSSDDDASSYHEDQMLDRHFDDTIEAIDKILTRTPREELDKPAEPTRPSISKYEELSHLREVLKTKQERRNLARAASLEEHKTDMATEDSQIVKDEAPSITGVHLDGVLRALSTGDPLLSPPLKDYEVVENNNGKDADQGGNFIGGLLRGIRKSMDLGNHEDSGSKGFFGDLMQKLQDKFDDFSEELRDVESKKRTGSVVASRQISSDKDSGAVEVSRPKSSMSAVSSELGIPTDRRRSPLPNFFSQPRMRTDYTTDSEMSVDYETRYKRPVPRRRRTRDRMFESSSDLPNSSANEDPFSEPFFFQHGRERRSSQPFFTSSLHPPKPPKRTKSTSNLSSSSLCVPPLPAKRVRSDLLMVPQPPKRTKSKERLDQDGKPPPLPLKSAHGKVPILPPVESATATLVSADRWQKGRLVEHRLSLGQPVVDPLTGVQSDKASIASSSAAATSAGIPAISLNEKPMPSVTSRSQDLQGEPGKETRTTANSTHLVDVPAVAGAGKEKNDELIKESSKTAPTDLQFQDAVSDLPWVPSTTGTSVSTASPRGTSEQATSVKTSEVVEADRPLPRRRKRRDTDEDGDTFYNASDIEPHSDSLQGIAALSTASASESLHGKLHPAQTTLTEQAKSSKVNDSTQASGLKGTLGDGNARSEQATTIKDDDNLSTFKDAQDWSTNESLGLTGVYLPGLATVNVSGEVPPAGADRCPQPQWSSTGSYGQEQYGFAIDQQAKNEAAGITGVCIPGAGFEGLIQGEDLLAVKDNNNKIPSGATRSDILGGTEEIPIVASSAPSGMGPQGAYLDRATSKIIHTISPLPTDLQAGSTVLPSSDTIVPTTMKGMGPQGMYLDRETGKMVYTGSGPLQEKLVRDYQEQGAPSSGDPRRNRIQNISDILDLDNIQDRFEALMASEMAASEAPVTTAKQPIYSKANKKSKVNVPPEVPAKTKRDEKKRSSSAKRMSTLGVAGLLGAPRISVSCENVSDSGTEKGLLSRFIPMRTKKRKKPPFLKIDPEQLARLPTMRPATPEPASPTNKNFLTVEDPNALPPTSTTGGEEGAGGETFTRRLIRRGSNALMGLTGSFRRHRSPSYIEGGTVPVDSPYQATVVDADDTTVALDVKEAATSGQGSSPSILRHPDRTSRARSAEPSAVAPEKPSKVQFISSPVHGRTLKSETKPANPELDPLFFEEVPSGPIKIDVTPSRQDIAFPVHGRKLKLATEGIAQPIRPTEESYLFSQYTTEDDEGVRGKMPDIDPRTQVTGLGRGDEKRQSIDDEFERDIFIPKQPKPPISLTKMLKGALTGRGLPWSSQLGGREWARQKQSRMDLHGGPNSLLGAMQVGAAGVEARTIFGEEARQRRAEEEAQKPVKTGRTVSLADLMDIRQSFRNEELARMVAGAPPDAVLAHVKASPYVDSMMMETIKKVLIPDFAKIRERLEERFRKKIPKEHIEKNYQPFKFDRGVALPSEEPTYIRQGPLRMNSVRNRIEPQDLLDPLVAALYGEPLPDGVTPYSYAEDSNEIERQPLSLTLPDDPSAIKRSDLMATTVAPEVSRSAHEVIREAAEIAAQPPPAPQIPPLMLPLEALAPAPLPVQTEPLITGVHLPASGISRTVDVPEPDADACNRRASLIFVNAKDLDLARPRELKELTSVNVDVKRLRQKLPSYRNFRAAEV